METDEVIDLTDDTVTAPRGVEPPQSAIDLTNGSKETEKEKDEDKEDRRKRSRSRDRER